MQKKFFILSAILIAGVFRMVTKHIIQSLFDEKIELISTHRRLSIPVINRIYKKMSSGLIFSEIKVDNNIICDGHHRYIASLLAGVKVDRIVSFTTSATIITDWRSVIFEEIDFDDPDDIDVLNMRDADYNNIAIDQIVKMLE